jgi:hypothetical protein
MHLNVQKHKEMDEMEVTLVERDSKTFQSKDITELRKLQLDVTVGYLAINLVEPPEGAVWGVFNDRELKPSWVNGLANEFDQGNLDNSDADSAVEAAVKSKWLDSEVMPLSVSQVRGMTIQDVPVIKFSEEGLEAIRNDNLWMFSGNHRRAALVKHVAKLKSDLEDLHKTINKVEDELKKEPSVTSPRALFLEKLKDAATQREQRIENSQKWVVRLYNRGEWHQKSKMDEKTEA